MYNDQNDKTGSLRASQEPHEREEMDQAERASNASFSLEPEKGIIQDPDEFNHDGAQENIKQVNHDGNQHVGPTGETGFEEVNPVNVDEDENTVTPDDLQALKGLDQDDENTM